MNKKDNLDSILNDIYIQINSYNKIPKKEDITYYIKLIELYFKGTELSEKLNAKKGDVVFPQVNFIKGVGVEEI